MFLGMYAIPGGSYRAGLCVGGVVGGRSLDHRNTLPMEKQKWWGQFSGLADLQEMEKPTLHHAAKDERATVQSPVKKPPKDCMSHRGGGGDNPWNYRLHPSPGRWAS